MKTIQMSDLSVKNEQKKEKPTDDVVRMHCHDLFVGSHVSRDHEFKKSV